jgi:hypothetical protein
MLSRLASKGDEDVSNGAGEDCDDGEDGEYAEGEYAPEEDAEDAEDDAGDAFARELEPAPGELAGGTDGIDPTTDPPEFSAAPLPPADAALDCAATQEAQAKKAAARGMLFAIFIGSPPRKAAAGRDPANLTADILLRNANGWKLLLHEIAAETL